MDRAEEGMGLQPGLGLRGVFARGERPPIWFWLLPLVVALLRTLPMLWLQAVPPDDGYAYTGVSFVPKDFLAYLGFIRQTADHGALIYYNPFTTDPQSPRFILLFHNLIGLICRATGLAPNAALELSRVPLTFLFFAALWIFLRPILTDRRDRQWACVLVAFSGGFEPLQRIVAGWLPPLQPFMAFQLRQATDPLIGWNTFASFFNPLWIAALIPALFVLRSLLAPEAPLNKWHWVSIGAGLLLVYWIHPYTAIGVIAIAAAFLGVEMAAHRTNWRRVTTVAAIALPTFLIVALVSRWQASDAVYRAASGNVFGEQQVSVFWYPLTLGALGFFALRGARQWTAQAHPWRLPLLAWIIGIALLHTSPLINGYKFVFLLHLPLCIVAAGAVREVFDRWRSPFVSDKWRAAAVALCLFLSTPLLTIESLREVRRNNSVGADYLRMVETMSGLPAGNAFVPPRLGNLLPAYTSHRVWVGQWFLTPHDGSRREWYELMTKDPQHLAELQNVLADQHIDYLVVPTERGDFLAHHLGDKIRERTARGDLTLFVLQAPADRAVASAR